MEQQKVARLFRVLTAFLIGANGSLNKGGGSGWVGKNWACVFEMREKGLLVDLNYLRMRENDESIQAIG